MKVKLLGAVAAACLVMAPALAYSQAPANGKFEAVDFAWHANDSTTDTSLTIATGGTVAFSYPAGKSFHTVSWKSGPRTPDCTGIPDDVPHSVPGWHGSCDFRTPGKYTFVCAYHDYMTGEVDVVDPDPTGTPTPTPTPGGTVTPGATATPGPDGTTPPPIAQTQNQAQTLTLKLASKQKGTRVRGTVAVSQANSRLEVTVTRAGKRVGRWAKTAAKPGTQRFSVTLSASTRRALARKSLKLGVRVALTTPGGKKVSRNLSVRLRG
jgi:plastocyanin